MNYHSPSHCHGYVKNNHTCQHYFLNQLRSEIGIISAKRPQHQIQQQFSQTLELCSFKEIVSGHKSHVTAFSLDMSEERYLISASNDSSILLYDIEEPLIQSSDMDEIAIEANHSKSEGFKMTPSKKLKKKAKRKISYEFDKENNMIRFKPLLNMRGKSHRYSISCVEWYPHDTGMFMTGGFDHLVRVWDTNQFKPVYTFKLKQKVYCISMPCMQSFSSCQIAVATRDPIVRICDLKSGSSSHCLVGHKDAVYCVQWSPSNEYVIATGSCDQTIRMWDIRRAGWIYCMDQFNTHHHPKQMDIERFSITKFSPSTHVPTAHNAPVNALGFTPDGKFLISSGNDNRIKLWDTMTGMQTLVNYPDVINHHQKMLRFAISANGKVVYHPCGNDIHYYDILTGKLLGRLAGHYSTVNALQYYPKNEELYSVGNDYQIYIWSPKQINESNSLEKTVIQDEDNWSDNDM